MTDTTAAPHEPTRRPKRERGALESLLTVTLGMEMLAVIFGTLAINGLGVLPSGLVFGGGAVLVLLLLIATRVVRYRWGVWFGHALQARVAVDGVHRDSRGRHRGHLRGILDLLLCEGHPA